MHGLWLYVWYLWPTAPCSFFFFFNITPLSTKGGWDTVGHGIWLPELLPEGEVANPFPLPSKQTSFLFCCRLLAVSSKPSRESPDWDCHAREAGVCLTYESRAAHCITWLCCSLLKAFPHHSMCTPKKVPVIGDLKCFIDLAVMCS